MASHHSHPLADAGLDRRFLGLSRHAGTGYAKRAGEIWLVLHADWTGVWRLDPRDERTVHLERALDGDRLREAADWAAAAFALAAPEPARADARLLSAANEAHGVPGADLERRAKA